MTQVSFDEIWQIITVNLKPGTSIRNWTALKGYLGDEFQVKAVTSQGIVVEAPKAKNLIHVPQNHVEAMWEVWEDYKSGQVERNKIRDLTFYSKYIISLLHWLEEDKLLSTLVAIRNQNEVKMGVVKNKYRGTKEYAKVYTELITAAKYRGTLTYQEIAKLIGLPLQGNQMGQKISQILAEISEDEVSDKRPMLSAIAVSVKGIPGSGFYDLARELGKLSPEEDDQKFWHKECQEVYDTWKVELKPKISNQVIE